MSRDTTAPASASVPSFWIDRTEATVLAYAECMRIGPCPVVSQLLGEPNRRGDLPITFVDRDAARTYCRFRDGRLPTQLEFERAARGNQSRLFPWGTLYNSMASNHGRFGIDPTDASDGYPVLSPVGSFPSGATPEGILDLAGNVAEWVEPIDTTSSANDSTSLPTHGLVCGGSHRSGSVGLSGAACHRMDPKSRNADVGFRCVYDRPVRAMT